MSPNRLVKTAAVFLVIALVAVGCSTKKGGPTTTQGQKGGILNVGAEQWPDCMNPITECAAGYWQTIMEWLLLPRLVEYDVKGNAVHSALTTDLPTTTNGGVKVDATNKANPFTLTFHLNPAAVWNDGSPITSKDVEFTWKAIVNTTGAYTTTGYTDIGSVDTTDPHTAVIHFKKVYADWIDLFGGNQFGVIEKAKFPTANPDKPNLAKYAATGPLTFSGGPWVQTSWTTTKSVFVRNDKYWGHQPLLDQMTWVPEKDQSTEIADLLSGTISVAFPQPGNSSIIRQLSANPNAKSVGGTGNFYEALWINNQDPTGVMTDPKVREAFMYAVDRNKVIDGLIHLNDPNATVLNCGPYALPGRGDYCSGSDGAPWSAITYQPDKALSILKDDGYDCSKVPASPCTKGGKSLTLSYRYCNGNARRQTTFDLVKDSVKAGGFAFNHTSQGNDCTSPLFTQTLPHGGDPSSTGTASLYQIGDYANGPIAVDPNTSGNFLCNTIPSKANGFGGANLQFYCNKQADDLMKQADNTADVSQRVSLLKQVFGLMFKDSAFLPLYNLPNVTMWRSDKVAGPVGDANASPYSSFIYSDQWYCAHTVTTGQAC